MTKLESGISVNPKDLIDVLNAEVDENQGLESPKTPDYYPDDDRDIPESPGTPDDPEVNI